MLGAILSMGAGLVGSGMQAFGGKDKSVKAYEDFLRSKGISNADARKMLSNQSGVLADKADLAKNNLISSLQSQGLGNSIVGAQAGLQADVEKNKSIVDTARQIDMQNQNIAQQRNEMLAKLRMQQGLSRRQGRADFFGSLLSGVGQIDNEYGVLTNWLNKPR